MILVCAAMRPELTACKQGIADARVGADAFETLLVGVGARSADPLRARLEDRNATRPRLVVSSGFAGSLAAGLEVGAWITASALAEWKSGAYAARRDLEVVCAPPPAIAATVVSADSLATGGSALARYAENTGGVFGVDMESVALAQEASRASIPFMVLRFVSDSPANPLPSFLAPMTNAISGGTLRSRLAQAAQGLREAALDPRGVARVAREGRSWTQGLTTGWSTFARPLVAAVHRLI